MSMNETPMGERIHIGIFGRRNAGKSSLMNAITGQDSAVVSAVKGTTTDPVRKAMELLPLGPVVFLDTPGLDDEGELGRQRVERTYRMMEQTDIGILVVGADEEITPGDREAIRMFLEREIPFLVVLNKTELLSQDGSVSWLSESKRQEFAGALGVSADLLLCVSALTKEGIFELKERIARILPQREERPLVRDLIRPSEAVVLVVPIDGAAPKGRLILPQQQVIRDILEAGGIPVVTKEGKLTQTLASFRGKPALVITDSQAFDSVARDTPADIPLTSFSILMSRYKGDLSLQMSGAAAIEHLRDGDKVLVSEGCTHHRQCKDIGTEKIPLWVSEYTKTAPDFTFTAGTEFPEDLTPYRMVIHCGGCTLNARQMRQRIARAQSQGVPVTNYGVLIAYMQGILPRVTQIFRERER